MTQLTGFGFVTTLILGFKKIENEDKIKYDNFYSISKAGIIMWNWKWHWCVSINLCYNYNKLTEIFRKGLRSDYWFSYWSHY